jgi:hypothetical protein
MHDVIFAHSFPEVIYVTKLIQRIGLPAMLTASFLSGSALTGVAFAYQGHMAAARQDLNGAISQLETALPDKGGHRVAAIDFTHKAILEVDAGILAGRQ